MTRLDRAAEVHGEAIAFVADVPVAEVTVTILPVMPSAAKSAIERGHDLRLCAAEDSRLATENMKSAAAQLQDEGWSLRDIAFALDLSFQRVQQLLATKPSRLTHDVTHA